MHEKGMHPGATWRKVDFQIHTPRDPQWSGSPHLPGGTAETEQARMEWAKAFVEKCLELRLSGIAITDHHDFCFVPYVQKALSEIDGPDRPWLFPGVEVTCQDAVQCLVLFDADTAADLWNRMFGGHLQNIDVPDPNAATNPQAEECGKAVADFISGIASDTILKNAAIVLPHASNDGAHKSMLRQGFSARFKTLPFDGVYTDKSFQSLDGGTKRKIYGEVLEWGSRRRGIVPTGDNRTADFRRLGAHTCWVRLGEPTAEAIRQAVLADVARFSYEVPTLPAQRIVCLKVHSALTGDNFRVHFNDGFTALIGGRGSGKSALLEYLRFALGRSAVDTATEGESGRDREESLLSTTLANGSVSVVLERDGVVETWSRHWKSREHIQVIVGEEVVDELTPEMAQRRFRARAFYQKQLSTLVSDRKSAADQITGIAAAEFVDQRRLLERDVAAAQRGVLAGFQRVVEFWVAEAEHRQHKATIADLQRRLASIKNKLAEEGLSAEHTSILEAAPSYKAASTLMEEISEKLSDDIVSIDELLLNMQSLNVAQWEDLAAFPEVGAMIESIRATKRKVVLGMRAAQSSLEELEMKQEELARTFSTRKSAFDEKHKEASAQQDSLRSLVEEQSRLVDELQSAIAAERKSAVRYEKLNEAPAELKVARDNLSESVDKLSAVLE